MIYTEKKLLLLCAGLLLIDLILVVVINQVSDAGAYHLDGNYVQPHSTELLTAMITAMVVSVPFFSLIVGAITSLFIYRQVPYRKRFWKGYLFSLAAMYGIFFLMGTIRVMMLW